MIYLIEIDQGAGKVEVRQYSGPTLWGVVADAEADITGSPSSRVNRVCPSGRYLQISELRRAY